MRKAISFTVKSVVAGLAIAFVATWLRPDWVRPDLSPGADVRRPGTASYADAVSAAAPAVVNVHSARVMPGRHDPLLNDPLFRRFFGDTAPAPGEQIVTSLGSGVIMSGDGVVLTNNHVIRGADAIQVRLRDGREASASVIGTDPDTDLAVLRVELPELPTIPFDDATSLGIGDVVLAIGNPFGVGQTVTMGIVSATGRSRLGINTFEDFIQTDAAINPGNSGGALVDAAGRLVGINTAIFSGGSQGIGFAIPATLAHDVMQQILERGFVARGWLGLEVKGVRLDEPIVDDLGDMGGDPGGVVVTGVAPGAPGDRAGLEPGDVITHIDTSRVNTPHDAVNTIARVSPGSRVRLRIVRAGGSRDVEVTVGQRPSSSEG